MSEITHETPVRRVDWIELFFDLAMVALVTELAAGLHGSPGSAQFLTFVAWSIPAWWAWTNVMASINVLPVLPVTASRILLIFATGLVGLMAASVTEDADRVWSFALANGLLRIVLLAIWVYRGKRAGRRIGLTFVYNGVTAIIWFVSMVVPVPWTFALWAVAILVEVLLLRANNRSTSRLLTVDVAHGSERLGLVMIILIGESVISVVSSLSQHWNVLSGVAALVGFASIAMVAWGFFVAGGNVIEQGMESLAERGNIPALLDTVMLIPYLIVASVVMFAAGLSTAVAHPEVALSVGASICFGGGLALFYLTNAVVLLRYGRPFGEVAPWAIPSIVLLAAVSFLGSLVPALTSVLVIGVIMVLVIGGSVLFRRKATTAQVAV